MLKARLSARVSEIACLKDHLALFVHSCHCTMGTLQVPNEGAFMEKPPGGLGSSRGGGGERASREQHGLPDDSGSKLCPCT